jgi:hypothetical protein
LNDLRQTDEKQNAKSDYDTGPWTIEEIDMLADEADDIISRGEPMMGSAEG